MFAAAQGREGDTSLIDELCEKYTMIEIIYEMKKYEEEHKEPEPAPPKVMDFWSRLSGDD